MTREFFADPEPPTGRFEELASLYPANPLATGRYADAIASLGLQPWILGLRESGRIVTGCAAFVERGRLSRRLEIPSLPSTSEMESLRDGLIGLCRKLRISEVDLDSKCQSFVALPTLSREGVKRKRCEFVLDLERPLTTDGLGSNHKRNIKTALKAGLQVRRLRSEGACETHRRLMAASMRRRDERGEEVPVEVEGAAALAFVRAGAGELFQALGGETVLSSILILRSGRGAYYQTSGTSPEGMDQGASHFLIFETAKVLQFESAISFNLGGAGEESQGLRRFKAGFGAAPVELEAARFQVGGRWQRRLVRAAATLYRAPSRLLDRRRSRTGGGEGAA